MQATRKLKQVMQARHSLLSCYRELYHTKILITETPDMHGMPRVLDGDRTGIAQQHEHDSRMTSSSVF